MNPFTLTRFPAPPTPAPVFAEEDAWRLIDLFSNLDKTKKYAEEIKTGLAALREEAKINAEAAASNAERQAALDDSLATLARDRAKYEADLVALVDRGEALAADKQRIAAIEVEAQQRVAEVDALSLGLNKQKADLDHLATDLTEKTAALDAKRARISALLTMDAKP